LEDLHFIERLERVSGRHIEMALGLYRDPDLVRFVLERSAAPETERVAISLDDPRTGPFVIVTREGHFVTCLGAGMAVKDMPIVTRERLTRLGNQHLELRERLAFLEVAIGDQSSVQKLARGLFDRAHRVSRETIMVGTMVAPLIRQELAGRLVGIGQRIDAFLRSAPRYLHRRDRLSSRDVELLETFWGDVWRLAHLTLLVHSGERETLDVIFDPLDNVEGMGPAALLFAGLGVPFWPVLARTLWAAARGGKRMLPSLKMLLGGSCALNPLGATTALALMALARAHPKYRAEIIKALRVGDGDTRYLALTTRAYRSACVDLLTQASEPAALLRGSRLSTIRVGALLDGQQLEPDVLSAQVDEPVVHANLYRGRVLLTNDRVDLMAAPAATRALLFSGMPDLVTLEPEDFYWSESDVARYEPAWTPAHSLAIIERVVATDALTLARPSPVVRSATPGRNEPCSCGSGKKYKRCCGA